MERLLNHVAEVGLLLGLVFFTIKFWNWKLLKGYDITRDSYSFTIFLSAQISTLVFVFILSQDEQLTMYLETLKLFGSDVNSYWTYIGVLLFGVSTTFVAANVVGHLLYLITIKEDNNLYNEMKSENYSKVILTSILIFLIGIIFGNYLLKPFLFDWISNSQKMIPIN
jgi:hypothetical protein